MKKILPFSVSLVIPVYNGSEIVIGQLEYCKKIIRSISKTFEIIVVDDNSKDNTSHLLQKKFIKDKLFKLYFNKKNLGISRNLRKIYALAKYEYVVLFSADGDWDPGDIKKMLWKAYAEKADIVIGKRNRSKYTLYRKIISYSYNLLPRLFFGIDTIDAGSIKVIRNDIFHHIPLGSRSVFFEAELIIKSIKSGYKVLSIPIHFKRTKKAQHGGKAQLVLESIRDLFILKLRGI